MALVLSKILALLVPTLCFTAASGDEGACALPEGNPCVNRVSPGDIENGIAAMFDPSCPVDPQVTSIAFCNFMGVSQCRECVYDDKKYHAGFPNSTEDRPSCDCCVGDSLELTVKGCEAANTTDSVAGAASHLMPPSISPETACKLPEGDSPCSSLAKPGDIAAGLGVIYDQSCPNASTNDVSVAGCNVLSQEKCRFCIRDASAYRDTFPVNLPPYPLCPCCVVEASGLDLADYPSCQEHSDTNSSSGRGGYTNTRGGRFNAKHGTSSPSPTPSPTPAFTFAPTAAPTKADEGDFGDDDEEGDDKARANTEDTNAAASKIGSTTALVLAVSAVVASMAFGF